MHKVVLPKKVTFTEGEEAHAGRVTVEPCFPGYGTTLGNSLRRVLLSSLAGAAVIGIKIKGADHEFAAIDHVREDVLEIILNLKKLRLKIFAADENEVIRLELKGSGEGKLTAGDITKNSQVEVANPELHIVELTDKRGEFAADIFVSRGYGYVSIENREESRDKEVGYIDVDSIFTPIQAIRMNVENVRVGQMTDWDKLILDITTDGTVTYREAFRRAVDILVEQFGFLQEQAVEDETGEKKTTRLTARQAKQKNKKADDTDDADEDATANTDEEKGEADEAEVGEAAEE